MQITRCLHTAILVSDLAQAERFYGEVLGLPKVDRNLRFPGAWYEVDGYQIHLMTADDYAIELTNPEKLGRNPHIAFAVADLDAAKAQLIEQGYSVSLSASGRAALFTRDPDGNVIELSQA
ncbi:MAG TPA: VOC family protein [Leptolyngbyaceae cyanobacterium M33_DOE_097]|uniref:Glyoxalase n=1 Tax=Oscillatoriales cyanobacterium SpSt-418 TaxID=2282169 RepID=A0A7C3PF70_9CYAN|nr:VOC family protein [Leptolyngbyaceae cyanobacterium M33_DOE_097]